MIIIIYFLNDNKNKGSKTMNPSYLVMAISVTTHIHVVYPVSTDGSSVVAEVILDGRNSHLKGNKETIKAWTGILYT